LPRVSAGWLLSQPRETRDAFLAALTPQDKERLNCHWPFWARDAQLPPPGEWRYWLLLAGRGFGKSRTGAEWAIEQARRHPKSRGALVARTAADVRDVMVEGESGIMAISPPSFRPRYEPSKRRLTWPNGSQATTFSGDEPAALRGPQHHWGWCDELASWRYPEAWDMFLLGLRLGKDPRCVITTTPKPVPHIRELVKDPNTHVTRGSTYENFANLAPAFIDRVIRRFEGTRLGRQELNAELLDDNPGALWKREWIDRDRVSKAPELQRIVVAVDPATTSAEGSADTGIVVAGIAKVGGIIHGYVLDDRSLHASPARWAAQVVAAYNTYKADRIVGEANQGGDMVEHTIRSVEGGQKLSYKKVHASRGKHTRAEPISALSEQGLVHHVGAFPELEDQLCQWEPGEDSPDRLDAMVWALTDLMVPAEPSRKLVTF